MRVLHVATTYQSLVTILAPKLAMLAQTEGFELHTASSGSEPNEVRHPAGIHHQVTIPRTIRPLADCWAALRLWRIVRRNRISLVHTHTAKAGIVGALAGWLAGSSVVHTAHGLPWYEGQNPLTRTLYRAIELWVSPLRRALFVQNRSDYLILTHESRLRCPVYFEGNGVDARAIARQAHQHAEETWWSHPPGSRILCVARLEPVKRLDWLIAAMEQLARTEMAIECIIAGRGRDEAALGASIREKGLVDRMRILYTPAIHSLIRSADIVTLVSEKEGIPRSLMEAMVLERAVVATNVPGTRELVVDGETGLLVSLHDLQGYCTNIRTLLHDAGMRKRYGKAGKLRVMELFNDRASVERWLEYYRSNLPSEGTKHKKHRDHHGKQGSCSNEDM